MKKMKMILALGFCAIAGAALAGPCGGCPGRGPGGCRPCHPGPAPHHWHGHRGGWGRGGCNFWPGFVGGVIGGVVANSVVTPTVVAAPTVVATPTVVTTPTVVATPTVVTTPAVVATTPVTTVQNVWVEGRYIDQVQPNGTVVRSWQPGHYEQQTIVQ